MQDLEYMFNPVSAVLTTAGLLVSALFFIGLVFQRHKTVSYVGPYALPFLFFIALAGSFGSLFYEYALFYLPCELCWWQRIFLYPQVVILGVALMMRDARASMYTLILSLMGAAFALYQYLLQMGIAPSINCLASGPIDCSEKVILGLGFVTVPLMALSGFLLLIVIAIIDMLYRRLP